MRIGVNCLGIFNNQKNGARQVLLNICRGWAQKKYDKNLVFFCYPGEFCDELKKICPDSEYVVWDLKTTHQGRCIRTMINQSFTFHRNYKKYNLDVIFFPQVGTGIFKYNIPVIMNPHDIQFVSHPELYTGNKGKARYYYWKWLYYVNFKVTDRIISISNVDQSEIESCYPKFKEKIKVIYDPIDVREIEISQQRSDYILAINIQYKHKNIITLIKAFELLSKKYKDYKLYLVGVGNILVDELKNYVQEHGLGNRIIFTGAMERLEMEELWRNAKLYVNPSIYEGFGMTAIESIILGVPTLVANLPVNHEVTEDLANFYNDFTDEKELAQKIDELINKDYDYDCAKAQSDKLREKYNYSRISENYWNAIAELR